MGLSKNSLVGLTQIDQTDLSITEKTDPNLKWSNGSATKSIAVGATLSDYIQLTSPAVPYVKSNTTGAAIDLLYNKNEGSYRVNVSYTLNTSAFGDPYFRTKNDAIDGIAWRGTGEIVIAVDSTTSYAGSEIKLTIA